MQGYMVQVKSRQWRPREFLFAPALSRLPGLLFPLLPRLLGVSLRPDYSGALSYTALFIGGNPRTVLDGFAVTEGLAAPRHVQMNTGYVRPWLAPGVS